jgi:hypothetical protein
VTENEQSRPAVNEAANSNSTSIVSDATDIERVRRRWRLRQLADRRKVSVALDRHCGAPALEVGEVDYDAQGLTLGYAERRAAGLRILSQESAA